MKVLVVACLLLVSLSGAYAAVDIKNHYFRLSLPGDWVERKGSDSEQFIVTSASRSAQLTISVVPMSAKGKNLEQIAEKMLEFRFAAERKAAADRQLVFGAPWRSKPVGGGVQINYMGHDSVGRYFFYTGLVTEAGVTSVTGELEHSDEATLHDFYKEVLNSFGY